MLSPHEHTGDAAFTETKHERENNKESFSPGNPMATECNRG
jgi:hypothetical protein